MSTIKERRKERLDRGIKVRSETLYALVSPFEILYLVAPRALLVGAWLLLPIVLLPWPYWNRVLLSVAVYALLALAFDFLASHVGLVCLGGAFFFGVGGYTTAVLNARLGLHLLLSIPLATVLGASFCTLALAPCLRLRGIYFTVVTLMYPLLAVRLIAAGNLFGGTEGFHEIEVFASPWVEHYGLIVVLLGAVFALRRFAVEAPGLVLRAVRDNDQAVSASGINVFRCRSQALFIASLLGCFAGAYYAHLYGTVGISSFALDLSILPIAISVIGGSGTLVGAVVGSLIVIPLGELLRDFGPLRIVVFALVLTAFIVLRSDGLLPFLSRRYQQFERWVEV